MKTILASVYAMNPYKGSEDGTGWNFVLQIARYNKVIAITRENNRPAIESFMLESPNDLYQNIEFMYFDTPKWMRFWKRGGQGAMLYYLLWQFLLPQFVRKNKLEFDLVHNLNFHNDWTPSFLWKLEKPMIWGPVGHHPRIPSAYLSNNFVERIKDRMKWFVKNYFWKYDPLLKKTISKSDKILVMHSQVEGVIDFSSEKKVGLSQVAATDVEYNRSQLTDDFIVISVGRFVTLKGFEIALEAFAQFYETLNEEQKARVKFKMIGKGPDEVKLKTLINKYELNDSVEILNWMSKTDLDKEYRKASVFLFPSHEGAGMVVAEALSYGLPVLCFDNCGPGELAGEASLKVSYSAPERTVTAFSEYLKILNDCKYYRQRLAKKARARFESHFRWDRKGEVLKEVYSQVLNR
ncbi:glycosyltransferase [Ancylomarina sp. DW003]|nr:glycosyltransferase [Ancylomarina sp. DW003]MDE5423004.1 glycosyltransferase [Ancylomarina sp. DW003]